MNNRTHDTLLQACNVLCSSLSSSRRPKPPFLRRKRKSPVPACVAPKSRSMCSSLLPPLTPHSTVNHRTHDTCCRRATYYASGCEAQGGPDPNLLSATEEEIARACLRGPQSQRACAPPCSPQHHRNPQLPRHLLQ